MSKKIFLIAGEASGDVLGARLMQALRAQSQEDIEFIGIGGPHMQVQGFSSMLPMHELCVMGLWEVLGELPRLMKLIDGVVGEIEKAQPDAVVTIDLPDFNFRVAEKLKARGVSKAKRIHYVAPSVWAWRPGRAQKIAAFLDGLICLFPFEPPYFTKHKLNTVFAGHPMVEGGLKDGDSKAFRKLYSIPEDAPVLGVFFGSRESELQKMSNVLRETASVFAEQYPGANLVVPTLPHLEFQVLDLVSGMKIPAFVVTNENHRNGAFKACDVAVAVSGTVGLELAYAGVPHLIAYKMHPLSWLLVKQMVKIKYAHLANIMLDAPVIPEFLQGRCNSQEISREILKLYKIPERRQEQLAHTEKIRSLLGEGGDKMPSARAAEFVRSLIGT